MDFRSTFDEVAELYDAIRPRYPEVLFAALITITGLEPEPIFSRSPGGRASDGAVR
jgi:hypothetical protein